MVGCPTDGSRSRYQYTRRAAQGHPPAPRAHGRRPNKLLVHLLPVAQDPKPEALRANRERENAADQQICDERLWQQHEGSFLKAVVGEHEREMRPLLALKGALGSRAAGDGQGAGLAAANKKKTEAAVHVARVAAVKEAQSEQALLRQAFLRKEQQLATQLKRVETEKMHALERVQSAEQVLARGESKDQARMDAMADESRTSRLKCLALSERLRQMNRLREQDAELISTLRSQLADRERRIGVLEGTTGRRPASVAEAVGGAQRRSGLVAQRLQARRR